ncbi:MAG: PAS domain S-box protein [Bryobacterales bacterium]|nr:PAS domain S-box protein [Bryobacterales bacterium]
MEELSQIFSNGLMPHGYCIQWKPALLWLHVVSDGLIALAYFAIPIGLHAVVRRHGELPFMRLFSLAAAFILACGTTHLLSIWTMWRPDYGVEGVVKAATAAISTVAAVAFIRAAPHILGLANIRELQRAVTVNTQELSRANEALRAEIEQRDQAEKALVERESRLHSIVDTAVNAILTIDEQGVVESMNPAAVRLFGYSESQVIGKNISMLMPPPDRDAHDGYLRRYRETGERRIIGVGREVVGRRFDGSLIPLALAVSEFDTARGRRFTGILSDLSTRKDFEKQLADSLEELDAVNRALEERNAELDDFAHTVSHDLKEPLRGIQTYCWTLVEDLGEQLGEEAQTRLSRIQTLAKRMDAMIDSVLEYSRSGRQNRKKKVDLNDTVQEALDMLSVSLRERGCAVDVPRPFPEAECDPVAVVESLKNLISNASKYNDKADKRIEIGWEEAPSRPLTLYVRDNGIGIEEAERNAVFRIFSRSQRGREFGEGTGAGLAIVKKLVERQGGRVWVESTPGKGSTFRFTLGPREP